MAKKVNWLGILAMVLVFGMTVLGCDMPDQERLIGEWESYPMTNLEFKSDNTVDIWVTGWGTKTFSYEANNKKLTITDNNGNSYTGTISFLYKTNEKDKLTISGFNVPTLHHLSYMNRTYTSKE